MTERADLRSLAACKVESTNSVPLRMKRSINVTKMERTTMVGITYNQVKLPKRDNADIKNIVRSPRYMNDD